MEEQSSASTLIAQKVEKIARMSEESQDATTEVNNVINQLEVLAKQMDSVMGKFKLAKAS